jgi:hypothetical protein
VAETSGGSSWSAEVRLATRQTTGGREYNRFNQSLSRLYFLRFTGDRRTRFLLLLTALASGRFAGRGFGEVTGPVVQLEVLLFQGRVDELDFDFSE